MAITDAIRKYGIGGFNIETIGESDNYETLLRMEAEAISQYSTLVPNGYNITAGGRGGRVPCSPEKRALISIKTKGRKPWNYGTASRETVERRARRGNKGGARKGSIPWNLGKKSGPMPEEQKQRIAETVRKVRAARFWNCKKRNPILIREVA